MWQVPDIEQGLRKQNCCSQRIYNHEGDNKSLQGGMTAHREVSERDQGDKNRNMGLTWSGRSTWTPKLRSEG